MPAYDVFGRLVPEHKGPIFECSDLCKCSKTCVNRQLQNGRQVTLELLRAQSPYQWTVRTLRDLKKGTFVTEIVGEVLDLHEAAHRLASYGPKHAVTNLLELRYSDGRPRYALDKTLYGNIANFIQHSCEPNLEMRLVYSEMHEEAAPRLALFSVCDIPAHSLLTVDFRPDPAHYDDNEIKRLKKSGLDFVLCNCSANRCRRVLWVDSKK
uniref:SET domain-containing protein n=1 Tax=Plectus sambesii TaxID=2011161 RepID=A0A914X3A5_9BILA